MSNLYVIDTLEETASGGLFMSNLYVIDTLKETTSGGLFMSNLCVIGNFEKKQQAAVSSWTTCMLSTLFLKMVSGNFLMSSLYVSIFGRQQVAAYLFEQLVCYCSLEDNKWQLLYEQLVGYWQQVADSS